MRKACIFDLDGTLAFTLDSMASVANELLTEYGLAPQPTDKFRYYCGDGADMLIRRCLADAGDPKLHYFPEICAKYRERFDENPLYKVEVYPHLKDSLEALKRAGVKMAVCSNKPHIASVKVVQALFGDFFDVVIGQSDRIRRKPFPDEPLEAAKIMGVLPEECMYFGDTGTDMQTGKAAGMLTAGVLWGYRDKEELLKNGADLLIEKPEDIWKTYEERKDD